MSGGFERACVEEEEAGMEHACEKGGERGAKGARGVFRRQGLLGACL